MLNRLDPLSVSELIASDPVPELVTVKVMVAFVPTATLVKVTGFGLKLALPWVPVPERGTGAFGLPASLLPMTRLADRAPVAVGLNLTWMVQFAPAAKPPPPMLQSPLFVTIVKSLAFVPANDRLLIVSLVVPVLRLVSVTARVGPFVPTFTLPKFSDVGLRPTAVPVPVKATVTVGVRGSLVATVSVAVRLPVPVGLNVTLIGQLPPLGARLAPTTQLPDAIAKSPAFVPLRVRLLTIRFCPASVVALDSVTVCDGAVPPSGTGGGENGSAAGVRVALIEQDALGARVAGSGLQVLVTVKSAVLPVIARLLMMSGILPLLVIVTV